MSANPTPLYLEDPLSIDEARKASRTLAQQRRMAEQELEKAVENAAAAEAVYRKRLATAHAEVAGHGTAAQRDAQARSMAADDAYERDLTAGMVKVFQERLRGLEGERSQLRALMDLSARTFGAAA